MSPNSVRFRRATEGLEAGQDRISAKRNLESVDFPSYSFQINTVSNFFIVLPSHSDAETSIFILRCYDLVEPEERRDISVLSRLVSTRVFRFILAGQ